MARRLRRQASSCAALGSPLYAELLERAAGDCAAGGPVWRLLRPHAGDPPGSMVPLRMLGAIHALVLSGRAPELAAHYPSAGGDGDPGAAWLALRGLVEDRSDELAPLLRRGVQTNEPARGAPLLGGFLAVAASTGLPLRLLEIGASAGLLLRFDRFHYRFGDGGWGDPASPLRIDVEAASPPRADARLAVAERAGCDRAPLDTQTEQDRITLLAYTWPDQIERQRRLLAAFAIAAAVPARVEQAQAEEWAARQLAAPAHGAATVVYHSIVVQYLARAARERLVEAIGRAGEAATSRAPVAWLRMEPAGEEAEVRLSLWPPGRDAAIARCGYHGSPVRWMQGAR